MTKHRYTLTADEIAEVLSRHLAEQGVDFARPECFYDLCSVRDQTSYRVQEVHIEYLDTPVEKKQKRKKKSAPRKTPAKTDDDADISALI